MSRVSVKMVQKFSTRFTGTVEVLLDIVVTFSVKGEGLSFQYTKVCSFLRTCDRNCMERDWKRGRKGFMVVDGWAWWQQGGHDLVELDTRYLVACFRKESQKKSGSRSGYRVYHHLFISPLKTEFSLYTVPLPFGGVFFKSSILAT